MCHNTALQQRFEPPDLMQARILKQSVCVCVCEREREWERERVRERERESERERERERDMKKWNVVSNVFCGSTEYGFQSQMEGEQTPG